MDTNTKFNYAIGRPWHPEEENSEISFYTYGSQIDYGSMADAEKFLDYCNSRLEESDENKYSIYRVVKI